MNSFIHKVCLLIVDINMMTKPVNIGMLYPILQQDVINRHSISQQ